MFGSRHISDFKSLSGGICICMANTFWCFPWLVFSLFRICVIYFTLWSSYSMLVVRCFSWLVFSLFRICVTYFTLWSIYSMLVVRCFPWLVFSLFHSCVTYTLWSIYSMLVVRCFVISFFHKGVETKKRGKTH